MSEPLDRFLEHLPRVSWIGSVVFTISAVLAAVFGGPFLAPAVTVAMALFVSGCVIFGWAFVVAAARSRTEQVSIAGVYFLSGSAPADIRRRLLGSVALQTLVGLATAAARPFTSLAFGVLAPMFGIALAGLWGARLGAYPARTDPRQTARRRVASAGGDGTEE